MANMTLISTQTVGAGGAASIDFTSIPGTYTDLMVMVSARSVYAFTFDNLTLTFNSTTSGWSDRTLEGSGSAATSGSRSGNPKTYIGVPPAGTSTSSTFGNTCIYIPNYAGSTNKSVSGDAVSENNASTSYQNIVASLWSNTSAITSINLGLNSGSNFTQNSTATLYGITKGSSGGVTVA